jgi:ABC-type polysaccharide/polyol phosphate export permease
MEVNESPTFRQSLAIQRRVLYALMMREVITRFGRENLGVLWLVGEPMIFTLGVAALWTASGLDRGSGIPVIAFAVTGYSSVLMWRNSASKCADGIEANKSLLYHRSVHPIDVLLTRITLEVAGATASFFVLSSLFIFAGWMKPPVDYSLVLGGWLMLAWFGASLALVIGGGCAFDDIVHRLWHPAAYLLFPMSGAAFMVNWLPQNLQRIVLLLPMVHGVELLRKGFFGNVVPTHYDIAYMALCCAVLSLAGLYLVREATRRLDL